MRQEHQLQTYYYIRNMNKGSPIQTQTDKLFNLCTKFSSLLNTAVGKRVHLTFIECFLMLGILTHTVFHLICTILTFYSLKFYR